MCDILSSPINWNESNENRKEVGAVKDKKQDYENKNRQRSRTAMLKEAEAITGT